MAACPGLESLCPSQAQSGLMQLRGSWPWFAGSWLEARAEQTPSSVHLDGAEKGGNRTAFCQQLVWPSQPQHMTLL